TGWRFLYGLGARRNRSGAGHVFLYHGDCSEWLTEEPRPRPTPGAAFCIGERMAARSVEFDVGGYDAHALRDLLWALDKVRGEPGMPKVPRQLFGVMISIVREELEERGEPKR